MTVPSLPPEGSTAWFDWATGVDTIAHQVDDGDYAPASHTHTVATAPAGSVFVVRRDPVTGNWPSGYDATTGLPTYTAGGSASAALRPTSRADITIEWEGADPPPDDVDSGTGGALRSIDRHYIPNA